MSDWERMTVRRAVDLIAQHEASPRDFAEQVLSAAARTESYVHAYAHLDPELVRARARALEDLDEEDRGVLYGVPVGIKDVLYTQDEPTEAGSRVLSGFIPAHDATAVEQVRKAGALVTGKLVTHEFACGQDRPPTRNPWNLSHYPGGSSAGAGVAVAVGSALAALGTDGGGSVRKPAALNGITGLKPTFGRISHHGVIPAGSSLDQVGILARSADDCDLLLKALAFHDSADPASRKDAAYARLETAEMDLRRLRLGVMIHPNAPAVDPEISIAFHQALGVLSGLGATIEEAHVDSLRMADAVGFTIFLVEAAGAHRQWLRDRAQDYTPATRRTIETGLLVPAVDLDLAQRMRRRICRDMADVLARGKLDALISPTTPITSMPLADMDPAVDVGRYLPYLFPANLTGQPAISVPCGITAAGLPTGMQIIGKPMRDDTVLRIARGYQCATQWHELRPSLDPSTAEISRPG